MSLRLDGIICDGASGVGDQLTHFAHNGTFKISKFCGSGSLALYEGTVTVTPKAAVGGTTSFLADGSGSWTSGLAVLAIGSAGFIALLALGGWYSRRRWLEIRS